MVDGSVMMVDANFELVGSDSVPEIHSIRITPPRSAPTPSPADTNFELIPAEYEDSRGVRWERPDG